MRPYAFGAIAVLWLGLAPAQVGQAHAATQTAEQSPSPDRASGAELQEVEVLGRTPRQIQYQLVKVQDRFYALYNDLNTLNDFDIHCAYLTTTGSTLRKRECKVEFLQKATAEQGREFVEGLRNDRPKTVPVMQPQLVWLERREEYRENVRRVTQASAELQNLAQQWHELQVQYEKALEGRESPPE